MKRLLKVVNYCIPYCVDKGAVEEAFCKEYDELSLISLNKNPQDGHDLTLASNLLPHLGQNLFSDI